MDPSGRCHSFSAMGIAEIRCRCKQARSTLPDGPGDDRGICRSQQIIVESEETTVTDVPEPPSYGNASLMQDRMDSIHVTNVKNRVLKDAFQPGVGEYAILANISNQIALSHRTTTSVYKKQHVIPARYSIPDVMNISAASAARAVIQTGEYDFAWNLQVEEHDLERVPVLDDGASLVRRGPPRAWRIFQGL